LIEIADIAPGSTAGRLPIKKGDRILSINGEDVNDVIDYQWSP
jgi:S1-C subfamily serine protease